MTSAGFITFCFFFFCFTSSVADPTGIKIRICKKALPVLSELAVMFLEELVDQPFHFEYDMKGITYTIDGLKLTELKVPTPSSLPSMEFKDSNIVFEFKDVSFTGQLEQKLAVKLFLCRPEICKDLTVIKGNGLTMKIQLRLIKTEDGKMTVTIDNCESNDKITIEIDGLPGEMKDKIQDLILYFWKNALCTVLKKYGLPKINAMLNSLTMTTKLHEKKDVSVNYGLSNDILINLDCLNLNFKGTVFTGDSDTTAITVKDIVFSKAEHMVSVGISELPFKSAGQAIFDAGDFEIDTSKHLEDGIIKSIVDVIETKLQIKKGNHAVGLDDVPTISIKKEGVSATISFRVYSLEEPVDKNKVYHVTCTLENMKVDVKKNKLHLAKGKAPSCDTNAKKVTNFVAKVGLKGANFVLRFKKYKLPLPEGIELNNLKIDYEEGYVVIAGDLKFEETLVKSLLKPEEGANH